MLDKAALTETSDSEGEIGTKGDTLAADMAETIPYSRKIDQLLDDGLHLVKDVKTKETNVLKRLLLNASMT